MSPADPLLTPMVPTRVTFAAPPIVLAQIADSALAALISPDSVGFESFRILRTKVNAAIAGMSMVETVLGEPRPVHCLGVVSATSCEGTSTTALGLAGALAQEPDCRVMLVEAGLRAPVLEGMLGLAREPGLAEWLAGGGEGPVPLRRVEPWGFSLLVGGAPASQSAELLGSEPMGLLLAAARRAFDFVLLDCPPLETMADSVLLQEQLDGFLLVVRARHASRDTIRRCLSHLKPTAIQGVVLNDRSEILARWLDSRRHRANR